MNDVRISVVIPAYNGGSYLIECIESVLRACEGLDSFEIIISDNHSTDQTSEIIQRYSSQNLIGIKPPLKLSIGENWSFVSSAASGRFIKFLGADDLLYGSLSDEINLLDRNPDCVALISKRDIIDWQGKIRLKSRGISNVSIAVQGNLIIKKMWRSGTNLIGDPSALLFRNQPFLEALPWEDYPYPYVVDLSLYLKCFKNRKVLLSPRTVSGFRIHEKSVTGKTFKGQARQFLGLYHSSVQSNEQSSVLFRLLESLIVTVMSYTKQLAKIIFISFISKS